MSHNVKYTPTADHYAMIFEANSSLSDSLKAFLTLTH